MTEQPTQSARQALASMWQVPVLLLGLVMLIVGLILARPSTPPRDFAAEVATAAKLIAAGQFDPAQQSLDALGAVYEQLDPATKVAFHLARGDLIAQVQSAKGWSNAENHRNLVKHYRTVQDLGSELDDVRLRRLADALLALDKPEEAQQIAGSEDVTSPEARQSLQREVLAANLKREGPTDLVVRQIGEFLADESLRREHQIWAAACLAEAAMAHQEFGQAADLIMRWLQRLDFATAKDTGPLLILLARAQLALGDRTAAERWFLQAQTQLDPSDILQGDALAGLGQVRYSEDNIVEALEYFTNSSTNFPGAGVYVQSLIGKAECEARLGWMEPSLETYDLAVKAIQDGRGVGADAQALADSLKAQRDWRYSRGEYRSALDYLHREEALLAPDLPAALLLKLAMAHQQIADSMIVAAQTDPDGDGPIQPKPLSQQDRIEAAMHFEKSGEYYHQHAQAVAKDDPEAYGESLWRAADAFDRSGLQDRAIEIFQEYAKTRPDDPRQLSVTFRLAQAYQAGAQFDAAIGLYQQLIESNPKSPEAYGSLVPMARCYLAKGTEYWDRAEHVLRSIVTDHEALRPESREYHDALIELGRLHYRRGAAGDYERAIEVLGEAVDRYPQDEALADTLFQLADAYRRSVMQINDRLREPLPPAERSAFAAERALRLAEAQKAFDRVIALYEPKRDSLNDLEALYLRNSYFYRADCAYDLGRYDGAGGAIELYDLAARRYENDPAVLVAQIQIVNSYCEMGKYDLARTANERARWLLKRIKDDAFDDPNLPMSRAHWQRWLDWTSELSLTEPAASATP